MTRHVSLSVTRIVPEKDMELRPLVIVTCSGMDGDTPIKATIYLRFPDVIDVTIGSTTGKQAAKKKNTPSPVRSKRIGYGSGKTTR